jgi:hypothetical protein
MHYNYPTHLRSLFLTGLLFVFIFSSCQAKEGPVLVAPGNDETIVTNTPVLAWSPIDCDWQEVWINGIKMDSLGDNVASYVPFALSFGTNEWQIVAVKKGARIAGDPGTFYVEDKPLAILPEGAQLLRYGWSVKSAALREEDGKTLSSGHFSTEQWYATSLPATVQTVLVRNGVYPNPYIGKNNMQIPDANDDFNEKQGLLKYSHIDGTNPWKQPYWYVKSFIVGEGGEHKKVWLNFNEINYRAELWLNGELLADTAQMVGMERQFRFDVTNLVNREGDNHLAVAIFPVDIPGSPGVPPVEPFGDPGVNMGDGNIGRNYTKWDAVGWDWQPAVRDRDMGITEDVFLSFTDDMELSDVYITSEPNLPEADYADMVISAKLINYSQKQKKGTLSGRIVFDSDTLSFDVPFSLSGGAIKSLTLDRRNVEQLRISDPQLWWPAGYGDPNLYEVILTAETTDGDASIVKEKHGIRKIDSRIEKSRIFTINGQDIFMKGGNWVIDMTLNWTASRYEEEILMSKNANVNVLRVWGPTGVAPKAFYDAADKHGILLWQDFLNDYWGTFKNTSGFQPEENLYQTISTQVVKRFRNHPSLIIWCGGNEGVNPREEMLVNTVLAQYDNRSGRFYLKASDGHGLHGGGPYHSIRPEAFFSHPKLHGFSSEIGASGVPVVESIRRFIPEVGNNPDLEHFPVDGTWAYHDAANFPGEDSRKFTALDNIIRSDYGEPETKDQIGVEDYFAKAQFQNYEAYRSAIGSIGGQMWDNSTGMLLWKSNSSWPSMVWQLYDWYQQAHAGYYGAKKAFAPFNVSFNKVNRGIRVVNARYRVYSNVQVSASLYDESMNILWKDSQKMDIQENAVLEMPFVVPREDGLVFLKLEAKNSGREILADNFYWLQKDNDFTGLANIASPDLEVTMTGVGQDAWKVSLSNNGATPALLTQMKLVDSKTGHEILPALWSDNFVSLLPGESREYKVTFPRGGYRGDLEVVAESFN